MKVSANDNSYMQLRGQGRSTEQGGSAAGFAMAALLVGMSVMAVLMGAALPVWNKQAQREREEEYLFRANEYARAIQKFQRRAGPETLPPTFDVLVQGRFLRRKYKDPFTGGDFQPIYQTTQAPGQPGGVGGNATPGGLVGATPTTQTGGTPTAGQGTPTPGAGVIGVTSKSKAKSIKIYNGRTTYDQWAVTYRDVKPGKGLPPDLLQALNAMRGGGGAGQPAGGAPGQPGGGLFGQPTPGGQPGTSPFGQPGTNPFGQPGGNPFGAPGGTPFGQPGGQPGASPFGFPTSPANPPLPAPAPGGGGIFGPPPKKG